VKKRILLLTLILLLVMLGSLVDVSYSLSKSAGRRSGTTKLLTTSRTSSTRTLTTTVTATITETITKTVTTTVTTTMNATLNEISLLIESAPNPSEPNQAITISGRLVSGSQGLGYGNVRIDSSVDQTQWEVVAWANTDTDGRFALPWTPPQSTSLYIRAYFPGDKQYSSSFSNTVLQEIVSLKNFAGRAFVTSDIAHDKVLGRYTVQNDKIKVVFHYNINEAERYDAAGGNIYELYDLEVDPTGNLANDAFGESGGTGPEAPGVGGLGSTKIWYEKAGERRICHDNNIAGIKRIASQSIGVVNGNVVYEIILVMKDYTDDSDLYQVRKKWTVFPDGRIKYELTWTMLQTVLINSPSINFAINPNYVDDFKVFREGNWVQTDYRTGESWAGLPHTKGGKDYNTGSYIVPGKEAYADKSVWLRNGRQRLTIRWDTTFEESGLFQLGRSFGPPPEYTPHGELSDYVNGTVEPFGISCRWFGCVEYPGNPYHLVENGKSWTDVIWLELTPVGTK